LPARVADQRDLIAADKLDMIPRRSLSWPITLAAVMIVLLVALIIGWVLLAVAASQYADYWWAVLAIGTTFLVLVLVGVVVYLVISVKEIALNRRQSNFIDSVTHELKSPIASLKLYLQTLSRRTINETQRAEFHQMMLEDLERLDDLINHLLDAARLDQRAIETEVSDVDLPAVLALSVKTACQSHNQPESVVELKTTPAMVRGKPVDVEMIFRNLIDNALKYSGDKPQVVVECRVTPRGVVVTRVSDNGPGIPLPLRSKIFRRFVRLGSELERSKPGTGLGLYIVDTLVRRMRGKVIVRGRSGQSGTVFEVQLPGVSPIVDELNSSARLPESKESGPAPVPTGGESSTSPGGSLR